MSQILRPVETIAELRHLQLLRINKVERDSLFVIEECNDIINYPFSPIANVTKAKVHLKIGEVGLAFVKHVRKFNSYEEVMNYLDASNFYNKFELYQNHHISKEEMYECFE